MADTSSPQSRSARPDGRRPPRTADADERSDDVLEPNDIFHILQTSRRRDALRYLRRAEGPVTLRELSERVAAREHDTTVERLTSSQRQRVYISLYQSHLPKLDNRGIIAYDKDRGTIERAPLASRFDPYLVGLEDESATDPWPVRYAAVSGCCGLLLAAVAGNVVALSWSATAVLVVLAFAVATAVHAYSVATAA